MTFFLCTIFVYVILMATFLSRNIEPPNSSTGREHRRPRGESERDRSRERGGGSDHDHQKSRRGANSDNNSQICSKW